MTINEHFCKYYVMKSVTFITETPYLNNCYPHLARNRNISNKKMSLTMFKNKTNKILTVLICRVTQMEHIIFSMWVPVTIRTVMLCGSNFYN